MSNQEYYLGICNKCGKATALKNGICANCEEDLPDIFKEIFKEKSDEL
jgi:predicted amidophosphoribosyltransferase